MFSQAQHGNGRFANLLT